MIDKNLIKVDVDLKTREAVFDFLANLVVTGGYASSVAEVLDSLLSREAEGTTGMMDGYAIPHAKSSYIQRPGVAVLKLQSGVDWDSMDGQLVDKVVALFIPENEAGTTHLQLLSKLARLLMRPEFKESFKSASTVEEIEELLERELSVQEGL